MFIKKKKAEPRLPNWKSELCVMLLGFIGPFSNYCNMSLFSCIFFNIYFETFPDFCLTSLW